MSHERTDCGFERLSDSGPAAIAVVRVCGAAAGDVLDRHLSPHGAWRRLDPNSARRCTLVDVHGEPLDDILLTGNPAAHELDIRLYVHGNPWIVQQLLALLRASGLREHAPNAPPIWPERDEFEAEAWDLMPSILSMEGCRWLLANLSRMRSAMRELQGAPAPIASREAGLLLARAGVVDWFRTPRRVALVGPPNAGKSTLMNQLAGRDVSLVSAHPGTTRDWVETTEIVEGFPVTWMDTAGLRMPQERLEEAGQQRTWEVSRQADATVLVLEATSQATARSFCADHGRLQPTMVAINKCDECSGQAVRDLLPGSWNSRCVEISARFGLGLDRLKRQALSLCGPDHSVLTLPSPFAQRQVEWLQRVAAGGT